MSKDTWPLLPLKELSSRIGDGIHGTPKYVELSEYPFINGNNLKNGSIVVTNETKMVSEEEYNKYLIEFDQNTLFMSINGTLGSLAKYKDETITLGKSAAYIKCNEINVNFLYYYLQLQEVQKHIWNTATGSTIKNLSLESIRNLRIPKPHEHEQKDITAVLSALDAKIELNNRINTELEVMAKTLYDYWFVQFDFPDKNGQPYKSSGGKMVYNEFLKREIPEGWTDGVASDLLSFNPELSLPKNTIGSYINMASIPTFGFMTASAMSKKYNGGAKFQNGDLVMARITPCLENGKTGMITLLKAGEIGFGSTEFIVIRGKMLSLSSFTACLSRSQSFRKFAILNMSGTSGRKRIEAKILETFSMPIPSEEILRKFEKTLEYSFKKTTATTKENHQLTQLRDWLLPMLMNGQVTVSNQATPTQ